MGEGLLPVHGFVLAGGKSSRMGTDKALMEFRGRPMVEIAVEILRSFCGNVSISGNRDDLSAFAPVVKEPRLAAGPAAGVEAGLGACQQPWALFVPVDVPRLPATLLENWARAVLEKPEVVVSYLVAGGQPQPAICLVRRDCAVTLTERLEAGKRRLAAIFAEVAAEVAVGIGTEHALYVVDAARYAPNASAAEIGHWFANLNTPQDVAAATAAGK